MSCAEVEARSHEETVRRVVDAFNRRDRAGLLALCDPDMVNVPPREWPESSPIRGREAVWDFYVEGNEPWEDSALSVVDFIDGDGDNALAHLQGEMRGRASGAGVVWSFWAVIVFRNGKPALVEWFANSDEAVGRFREAAS